MSGALSEVQFMFHIPGLICIYINNLKMAIPIHEKPIGTGETCTLGETTCSAEPPQPEGQTAEQTTEEGAGIRTTPIPIPAGTVPRSSPAARPAASSAGPPLAGRPPPQPGLNSLVRFLRNPEGAMQSNDSAYLRTMYSTDQADLVLRSAMSSSGYY